MLLSSLLNNREKKIQAQPHMTSFSYEWEEISRVLAIWLADMNHAHDRQILAIGQTLAGTGPHANLTANADSTFLLSFFLNPTSQESLEQGKPTQRHDLLPLCHDYDNQPVSGTDRLIGLFAGRKKLTRELDDARHCKAIAQNHIPNSVIALYRPEGIVLFNKHKNMSQDEPLHERLKTDPQCAKGECIILQPEAKSAHDILKNQTGLPALLTLANLFCLALPNGDGVEWTQNP